jgi:ubiquitin C-terminal hydrolase
MATGTGGTALHYGGHYYAYIRPDLRGQWFKFDDERVTKVW